MSKETREYAKQLVSQMTLEEKMSQMVYQSPAIERLKSCCRRSVMLFLPRDVQNSTSFREKATAASIKA